MRFTQIFILARGFPLQGVKIMLKWIYYYLRSGSMSQIIRDMLEISRCGVQYRSDNLAPLGLKSIHASYLTEICANPGISQDRLARLICINKSNVARQVAVLEEDGFIRRVPSEADKRVMELYPTEKTLELLPKINEMLACWDDCITQDLSEEEKTCLSTLLSKMSQRASRYMEDR
jgi:DNA-binding MarR family transcriptional regulator